MDKWYIAWFKYIVSGLVPTSIELGLLFVLVEYLGVWYLLASAMVLTVSFCVSFTLRKFWVFKNNSRLIMKQAGLYGALFTFDILVNLGLMYVFVDYFFLPYLFAQIIANIFLGIVGFLFNRYIIFKS